MQFPIQLNDSSCQSEVFQDKKETAWIMWLPRFLQNTNNNAKYYDNKKTRKKVKVTYTEAWGKSSEILDIKTTGLIDEENHTDIEMSVLFFNDRSIQF